MTNKFHILLITFSLIITSSVFASITTLSADKPVWVINEETNLEAILVNHGLINEEKSEWLISDTQIVLLGNVFDADIELTSQLEVLNRYQSLAETVGSRLELIQGTNEYALMSAGANSSALPMLIQWQNHLIAHRGISLKAQRDDFDTATKKKKWSDDIHLPMYYQGTQICHPYFETDRLRTALGNLAAETVWVGRAEATPNEPWQIRLKDKVNILGAGVIAKLTIDSIAVMKGEAVLNAVMAPARFPANPVGMTDDEIIDILTNGEVVAEQDIPIGITKPVRLTLMYEGKTIDAIYKTYDSSPRLHLGAWSTYSDTTDRFGYEYISYQIDRMLGLGLVPAVVIRDINSNRGSLQVWYDDLISKMGYRDANMEYLGHCDRLAQREMMHVFDFLIRNEDRNQSNMLYNKSDWQIWFIDHSRAYDIKTRRHPSQKKSKFSVTPEFREALDKVEKKQLYPLRSWLHREQINSLFKRLRRLKNNQF